MQTWTEGILGLQLDHVKRSGWLPLFQEIAPAYGFKTEELLGIGSRETNLTDIRGDFHNGLYHGFGILQVDIGTDPIFCHNWKPGMLRESITRGTEILAAKGRFLQAHNKLEPGYLYAAYNCGEGTVVGCLLHNIDPDTHTTGKDYGRDVVLRVSTFAKLLGEMGI